MKKLLREKAGKMYDVLQLSEETFDEVVDLLMFRDFEIDKNRSSKKECYIEACGCGCRQFFYLNCGTIVVSDQENVYIMSEELYKLKYEEVEV